MSNSDLRSQAQTLDSQDNLRAIREEFRIPTRADVKRKTLIHSGEFSFCVPDPYMHIYANEYLLDSSLPDETSVCTYLCGNSLGLQPKRTAVRIQQYLETWGTQGVQGHFKPLDDSPLPTWLDADSRAAKLMAPLVGADESEVAVQQTLTANLHLLMNAFYRPDINGRHKIILEARAFPSDHVSYSVVSFCKRCLANLAIVCCVEPDLSPWAVPKDVYGDSRVPLLGGFITQHLRHPIHNLKTCI